MFSLKFMIVYDILCVSVFLHSTNDRHARTVSRSFVTQESLFKKFMEERRRCTQHL